MSQSVKTAGLVAEQRFILKALEQGLSVSVPIATESYDFVVTRPGSQWARRVQVKSCSYQRTPGKYNVAGVLRDGKSKRFYDRRDADVIAIVLNDDCYLIEVGELDKYRSGGKIVIEAQENHPALENWRCV